jgi:hypothetical protein
MPHAPTVRLSLCSGCRGKRYGAEWCALNPRRNDRRIGSFRVNLRSGQWADFAIQERGGDLIALGAYLYGLSQAETALKIAQMLGVNPDE